MRLKDAMLQLRLEQGCSAFYSHVTKPYLCMTCMAPHAMFLVS